MAFEGLELPEFLAFDNFVDDSLINTCTLFDEVNHFSDVQMQNTDSTEKSPFHESDSGVSDIGGNGSPLWENDIPMLDEMLDNPIETFLFGSDEIVSEQKEVVNNVQNGVRSSEKTDSVPEHVINSQTNNRKTRSQSAVAGRKWEPVSSGLQAMGSRSVNASTSSRTSAAKKLHDDSYSEDEIDIEDKFLENTSRRKPKGSFRVKRAGDKLPSTATSDKCSVTSVKVLRIVKSGNDGNAEEDIAKALEERNRKNAEMARQNRLKKKEYVGNLENEVEDGRKRIGDLESALKGAEEERDSYKREVEYLKSVLANQSALAGLLKNIPSVSGVTLSSSISRKRVAEHDHSYTPLKKGRHDGRPASLRPAGVCLHVDSGNVSLEFCHHCADMAKLESSP